MVIDPVIAVIVILVLVVALGFGGTLLADRANKREMYQVDTDRREERANLERLERERLAQFKAARQEESGAMEGARKRMAFAEQDIHDAQAAFKEYHDQLIGDIHGRAKAECDALFKQRFGITRPPKAASPQDDPEVQDHLRERYADLRDAVLKATIESLVNSEVDRRTDQAQEEASMAAPEIEAIDDIIINRGPIETAVNEEFDFDSIRTYLLAAISARYDENGRPIGELPWPAYTRISSRGFGELVLAEASPIYAQDAYREFAWKKFHTGRRAEKPERGEYSWPASHALGDGILVQEVPTPAGVFSVRDPFGTATLNELLGCSWMRHSMEYQGALLEPDGQRSFFINLRGLHKGDTLELHFDAPDFLEEAEDGPFFLNAMGEVNGAYVGISASKPEAANLGEAPYELAERTPTGFVFHMTHDARRFDVDTYPQFLEVHLAWCQPPAPKPERIVRHVTN